MSKAAARFVLLGAAAGVCCLPSTSAFVPATNALRTSSAPPVTAPHTGGYRGGLGGNPVAAASAPLPTMASSYSGRLGLHGVHAGCSGSKKATRGQLKGIMRMTSTAVDVIEDGGGGGGGGGSDVAVVGEEFSVKTDLLNQIDLASSSRKRTEVNELMLKLEPMNPTESPARSPVLNGVWEFLYTGGRSPGTLAVQVLSRLAKTFSAVVDLKSITLTVKRDQPRVEAALKASVLGAQAQVKVRTRLEQRSDMRLQEVYEEAEVAGVKIPIPARIQPRRTVFITYLDDDIMIARDDSGAPDLLIRKEKEFRFNTGTPSTSEDDASPGSG